MDRLSPMSSGVDSGIHSVSSPATPQKKRQLSPPCECLGQPDGTDSAEEKPILQKKQRLGEETADAFVPRSANTSVESQSLERSPTPIVEKKPPLPCAEECRQQPSTSAEIIEDEKHLETSHSHLEESEEKELLDLQDVEINIQCQWDTCKQKFPTLNDVYDHVVQMHLEAIGKKNDEEEIECMWDDCEMSLSRGNWNKKVNWLREHYRTRHAKHAQTFKCLIEGCSFRSVTCGRLEEHVRKEHITEPKKQKTPRHKVKTETWAEWQHQRYWPTEALPGAAFAWGRYYNLQLQDRMCKMRDMDWNCRLEPRRRAGVGAAHRKCSIVIGFDIVPVPPKKTKEEKEREEEEEEEVDTSYQSLTLDDLFPGYNYSEKKELVRQEELKAHEDEFRKLRDEKRYQKWRKEHNREQQKLSNDDEIQPC